MDIKEYYEMGIDYTYPELKLIYKFSTYNKNVVENSKITPIGVTILDSDTGIEIGYISHKEIQSYLYEDNLHHYPLQLLRFLNHHFWYPYHQLFFLLHILYIFSFVNIFYHKNSFLININELL